MKRIISLFFAILLHVTGSDDKPNILFLMLDDVSFEDVGAFQDRKYVQKVMTPEMDKFAHKSVMLTNLHAPSSVCTPARYSTMTGKFASRAESVQKESPPELYPFVRWNSYIEPGDPYILPRYLKDAGYTTAMIGKWHISEINPSLPMDAPKEIYEKDADPSNPVINEYLWKRYDHECRMLEKNFGFDHVSRFTEGNAKDNVLSEKLGLLTHNPEWVFEGALEFLEKQQKDPFFMYLALTLLHDDPLKPLKEQPTTLTPAGILEKPINIIPSRAEILKRVKEAGLPEILAGNLWMDLLFGALIDKLEELGLRENTVIIVSSDHGLQGKGTCYEKGTRSLTMVNWPKVIEGDRTTDALLSNVDHLPTILEIAGVKLPNEAKIDGKSYLPILKNEVEEVNEYVYFELGDMRGIRNKEFKYITRRPVFYEKWNDLPETKLYKTARWMHNYYFRDFQRYLEPTWSAPLRFGNSYYQIHAAQFFAEDQLYYLPNDPDELSNLANDSRYDSIKQKLRAKLQAWLNTIPGGQYPL